MKNRDGRSNRYYTFHRVSRRGSSMRLCPACGSRNADEAVFCSTCGATLTQPRPSQAMQPAGPTAKPVPIVKTITPLAQAPQQLGPAMVRPPVAVGSCFYHPDLPASYICVRCGRALCYSCTKPYGQLAMCPQCYWVVVPRTGMRPQA